MTFFSSLRVSAGTSSPVVSEVASSVTVGIVSSTAAVGSAGGLHLFGDVQVLQHEPAILALCHAGINFAEPIFKPAVGNGEASVFTRYDPAVKGESVRSLLRGILPQTCHLRLIRHGVGRDPDLAGNRILRNARTHRFIRRHGTGREGGKAAKERQRKQNRSQPPAISMYAHSFAPCLHSIPAERGTRMCIPARM